MLTPVQKKEVQDYYLQLTGKRVSLRWHSLLMTKTGVFNKRYLPFEIYDDIITSQIPSYTIMSYFDDKSLYRYFFKDFNLPERIAECYRGIWYLPQKGIGEVTYEQLLENCLELENCIIKPSKGSSAGIGVRELTTVGMSKDDIDALLKSYKGNFVIEKKIDECENLKKLNPSSCNSLRIHTYRSSVQQKVEYVSSYIRIGREGKVIDNASSGGITCQILPNGCLGDFPCTVSPYKKIEKSDAGIMLSGYKIEHFPEMVETAVKAHSCIPLFGIIGWDICADKNGNVIIIEYNPNPDMRKEQLIFKDTVLLDKQEEILTEIYKR